jgi:hypothetical protein
MKNRKIKSRIPKGRRIEVPQGARVASSKKLRKMKRDAQSTDRSLVAKGGAVDEMFLIRPDIARNAKIDWPADE